MRVSFSKEAEERDGNGQTASGQEAQNTQDDFLSVVDNRLFTLIYQFSKLIPVPGVVTPTPP